MEDSFELVKCLYQMILRDLKRVPKIRVVD